MGEILSSYKLVFWFVLFCLTQNGKVEGFHFSLSGTWKVVNSNQTIQLTAQVPGEIYTDLFQAKIIGNILVKFFCSYEKKLG